MLIDWFTVGAQALNFLILVWLLKHFLYKPILDAIAAREKGIAAKLADTDGKTRDAQKQRDEFEARNKAFDEQRAALLSKAVADAKTEHDHLIDDAHKEAGGVRASLAAALKTEQATLGKDVSRAAGNEVFAIARKVLQDLASASLEERMGAVFTNRLGEISGNAKHTLGEALKSSQEPAVVQSAFEMPAAERATIQNALNETFAAAIRVRFEAVPDHVCGIELAAGGQKVSWSIAEYLTSLERKVSALLETEPLT